MAVGVGRDKVKNQSHQEPADGGIQHHKVGRGDRGSTETVEVDEQCMVQNLTRSKMDYREKCDCPFDWNERSCLLRRLAAILKECQNDIQTEGDEDGQRPVDPRVIRRPKFDEEANNKTDKEQRQKEQCEMGNQFSYVHENPPLGYGV